MTNPRDHIPTLSEAVESLSNSEVQRIFDKLDHLDNECADDDSNISAFIDAIYDEVKRIHPTYPALLT